MRIMSERLPNPKIKLKELFTIGLGATIALNIPMQLQVMAQTGPTPPPQVKPVETQKNQLGLPSDPNVLTALLMTATTETFTNDVGVKFKILVLNYNGKRFLVASDLDTKTIREEMDIDDNEALSVGDLLAEGAGKNFPVVFENFRSQNGMSGDGLKGVYIYPIPQKAPALR